MKTRRDRTQEMIADINITPFTDVVLVLLIIFMIATPLIVANYIKVDLPKALAGTYEEDKFITVSIDYKSNVFLGTRKVAVEDLQQFLTAEVERRPGIMVKINGDRSLRYSSIVRVVEATRNAGIIRYMFVTDKPKDKQKAGG